MQAENDKGWFSTQFEGFGQFNEADDMLHPDQSKEGDSLTETQYFGFNIPEKNIYCFAYFWLHPNLDVISAGLFACQGLKRSHMQAELFDIQAYVSRQRVISNDLRSFRFPNGYQVDVLEPGRKMRLRYEDTARGNRLDVTANAIMPVAMRGNNKHFEQAMKMEGELVLRGAVHRINGYNVRDRSWGELRPEEPQNLPPMTWMTGTFGNDFAFNCNAFDHPDFEPEWKSRFPLPPDCAFNDGWVYTNGELLRVKTARKITRRDPASGQPQRHHIEMTDARGRHYVIEGEVTAGLPWAGWPNMVTHLNLTRWTMDGREGWGDSQEVQWTDYVSQFTQSISG
eukprot:TRINITY_DN6366_c0_g1_i25.p1 TRINITY_DN6366_c0_g1~~TRINITY_DN6366_c0_g1_i25.p1  ORF type:complete len:340 (+),score=69.46 TRINITY_DN6366_c0_g1_i25:633-1652(+)